MSSGKVVHGHRGTANNKRTRTYITWDSMKQRCNNRKHRYYADYGGRGIKVCERWKSFVNFLADMGERPLGMTLERVDGELNYCPENCVWADIYTQNKNRRKRRLTPKV